MEPPPAKRSRLDLGASGGEPPCSARSLVCELLRTDPAALARGVQAFGGGGAVAGLRALLAHLGACRAAVEERLSRALEPAPPLPALTGVGARALGSGAGELAGRCLAFLGPWDLCRVRLLSRQWGRWAEADELWGPPARSRWCGAEALAALHASGPSERLAPSGSKGPYCSLYLQRCRLERNKVCSTSLLEPNSPAGDISNYSLLVELLFGGRCAHAGLCALSPPPEGSGLQAPLSLPQGCLPIDPVAQPVCLSLTVVRRIDGKLMRICHRAELSSEWTSEDGVPFYGKDSHLPFRMGGDAGDGLTHPALWSVISEPLCHHVALVGARWSPGGAPSLLLDLEAVFVSLWDPRELPDSCSAARLLTVWEEVAEWV
mmetsp:Transcript_110736/g.346389  ORF Transcript_110736/g.346389 Transcript_110736/m.346389 type:complete len:375 (+) Transcript_110736:106-1230(+)